MGEPTRVVFVACKGRSGSTLLDRLLGGLTSVFSCGELDRFWALAGDDNERCSCGSTLARCPVWSDVAERPAVAARLDRRRHGAAAVTSRRDDAAALYQAVAGRTGCSTIVDSSKSMRAMLRVARQPDLAVSAVHLVRDPRAVAYSWSRPKPLVDRPGETMQRRGPVDSALTWLAKNVVIEAVAPVAVRRSVRIRYEDLAVDPQATLDRVSRALFDVGAKRTEHDAVNHQIAGNPARFAAGSPRIQLDTRWSTESSARLRLTVSALTWPLARAYGYV